MLWWSLACATHGLTTSFGMLAVSRFLLGMGEGGGFPAATKAVAEWFTPRESATAMGIVNAGTAAGAVCAPPLIALTLGVLNWRWVFFLSGAMGLWWCCWWTGGYRSPLSPAKQEARVGWFRLLGYTQTWGLVCAKFLSDAAWYFYLFWLPKYLYDARGFDTRRVGAYAWIP